MKADIDVFGCWETIYSATLQGKRRVMAYFFQTSTGIFSLCVAMQLLKGDM